jgi:hypothetical protein
MRHEDGYRRHAVFRHRLLMKDHSRRSLPGASSQFDDIAVGIAEIRHRIARRDDGSGDLEAARGAGALAGDEGPLTASLRAAVIGDGIGGLAAAVLDGIGPGFWRSYLLVARRSWKFGLKASSPPTFSS